MTIVSTAVSYGLLIAVLAIGSYITFSILRIPDLTSDGSFCLGAVVCGAISLVGHPYLGLLAGIVASALAGLATGLLSTRLKISPILSGVLVATGLISVIDWVPGWFGKTPSFYLRASSGAKTIFDAAGDANGLKILILLAIIIVLISLLLLFFRTQLGLSIRATGNNETMVRSSSINADRMKVIAFTLSNAVIGLAGGLYVQYSRAYSSTMGSGMLVTALAAIILAEVIFGKKKLFPALPLVVAGALLYRLVVAVVIRFTTQNTIKIGTAAIVILAIAASTLKDRWRLKKKRAQREKELEGDHHA